MFVQVNNAVDVKVKNDEYHIVGPVKEYLVKQVKQQEKCLPQKKEVRLEKKQD